MTATITSIAQGYNDGARAYCFHARTSTVAAGSLWTAQAVWWFVSQAGVITKRHHGLELVHLSVYDGERIDLLIVDQAGTAEWATPTTTSVGSTFNFTAYVDADAGNDSNDGLTTSTPKLTLTGASGAMSLFRGGNWTTGGEHRLFMQGTFSVASPTGGQIWNFNTLASGGGSELTGRMHFLQWPGETAAVVSITTDDSFSAPFDGQALHIEGVGIDGSFVDGGTAISSTAISINVSTTGFDGPNCTFKDMDLRNFAGLLIQETSPVAIAEMANGSFDWVVCEGCTFGACSSAQTFLDRNRYFGFSDCTWESFTGPSSPTGLALGFRYRCGSYGSWTDCSMSRSTVTTANVFRLPAGNGVSTWDRTQFISIHNHTVTGVIEALEFEQASATTDRYYADVWVHDFKWDSGVVSFTLAALLSVSTPTGFGTDLTRIRFTNCHGRSDGVANPMIRIVQDSSATTAKTHSFMIDQCTWYQEQAEGFFTRSSVLLQVDGNAANNDDDAFFLYGNYAFCADTDANSPRDFFEIPSAADKIGGSDYNVFASAGTNTCTWSDADTLAAWQGATAFDDNSFVVTSASHNMTTVTALSFNAEPAADGTPSASLPQVRRGRPSGGYADADRYLRDASLPDAGAHEYGTGTLLSDPSFGGGSYPNGQTDGFCSYS